jgi:hypothetical protein
MTLKNMFHRWLLRWSRSINASYGKRMHLPPVANADESLKEDSRNWVYRFCN